MIDTARELGLAVHLDGARLLNASVASGIPAAEYGGLADMVQICFSKGSAARPARSSPVPRSASRRRGS